MALPIKFTKICFTLGSSPRIHSGNDGSNFMRIGTSLTVFADLQTRTDASTNCLRSIVFSEILSSLASIFEKSRISVIKLSKWLLESQIILAYSNCSGFKDVSRIKSDMPIMALSGVRISWLMVAKNVLFARLEESAISLALINSSAWAASIS